VQRQLAQVRALERQDAEGVELVIMPARVQSVEIRYAIDAKQHRLAIDDERGGPVPLRGLNGQRVSVAPIRAAARKQANALALALDDQDSRHA
jgi:hypothetical protein